MLGNPKSDSETVKSNKMELQNKSDEDEVEEGEASDSDEDVEVNVIIGVEDNPPKVNKNVIYNTPGIFDHAMRPPGRRTPPYVSI